MQLYQRLNLVVKRLENNNRAAFCKKIEVSPSTFIGYLDEKGQQKLKIETIIRICDTYPEINRNWLFFGEGEMVGDVPEEEHISATLQAVFADKNISTTPQNFARIGGITVEKLEDILKGQALPPLSALRKWSLQYRVNLNFLIARIGQPLMTREQYEQDGPFREERQEAVEFEFPAGARNPDYGADCVYERFDRTKETNKSESSTMPLIGLAECGVEGWSQRMQMAASIVTPKFHKDMIAALAVGDSMLPAGIAPGNVIFADPRLTPQPGEMVYVEREYIEGQKGDITVKLFEGIEDETLTLRGWLPKKSDENQKEFCIETPMKFVKRIAPVVMIRKRAD